MKTLKGGGRRGSHQDGCQKRSERPMIKDIVREKGPSGEGRRGGRKLSCDESKEYLFEQIPTPGGCDEEGIRRGGREVVFLTTNEGKREVPGNLIITQQPMDSKGTGNGYLES